MAHATRLVLVSFLVVFAAAVALPAPASALKIAVVDMAAVYKAFKEVTKSQAYLKEKKDEFQQLIDKDKFTLKEEELQLENLKEDLRKNKDKYSPADLAKKEGEQRRLVQSWQKKFQAMKTKFDDYRVKLEDMEREEFQKVREKIDRSMAKVSAALKIELALEKQWVYFPTNMYDMTGDVIKDLEGK